MRNIDRQTRNQEAKQQAARDPLKSKCLTLACDKKKQTRHTTWTLKIVYNLYLSLKLNVHIMLLVSVYWYV